MRVSAAAVLLVISLCVAGYAQKPKAFPPGVPVKDTGLEAAGGHVDGRTYENKKFNFRITVPDDWFVAGPDFERILKENGHDLGTEAITRSGRPFDVLLTAFRSDKIRSGAVLRVTAENVTSYPQIRDAVDYLDAITAVYASVQLPSDFTYSAVKAEALGSHQFAYLDTTASAGKKRMYVTVRNGWAVMFTLSYFNESDLQAVRDMLAQGEFAARSAKH